MKSALKLEVQRVDWEDLFSNISNDSNPSTFFDCFYTKISNIVDKHVPIKELSKKEKKVQSKPWITYGIRTSIQIKNTFYKKYLKTKYQFYFDRFKFYRNKINHLTRICKKQYYNNYFIKNATNGKQLWKGIKQMVNIKNKYNPATSKIIENGRELSDPRDIAKAFCNYFANIGNDLEGSIPIVSKSPLDYIDLIDLIFLSLLGLSLIVLKLGW